MTRLQILAIARAVTLTQRGEWLRASGSGDRVTLASLHTRGLFTRRARRGVEGHPSAAYEYQATPKLVTAVAEALTKKDPQP